MPIAIDRPVTPTGECRAISGRDLILIFGGMFLIAKSTREINHEMEGEEQLDLLAQYLDLGNGERVCFIQQVDINTIGLCPEKDLHCP